MQTAMWRLSTENNKKHVEFTKANRPDGVDCPKDLVFNRHNCEINNTQTSIIATGFKNHALMAIFQKEPRDGENDKN